MSRISNNKHLYEALYNTSGSGRSNKVDQMSAFLDSVNNSSKTKKAGSGSKLEKNKNAVSTFPDVSNALSDLSLIKKGTYKKLLSSYYEKYGNFGGNSATDAVSTEISNLKDVASDSAGLKDSVTKLKKMDFSKEESKDSALKAAKDFTENYNALIDSSVEVNRQSVLKNTLNLVNYMKKNSGMLNELGMKLGSDNKITFDEDKWNNAYATSKSSMFSGVGSFGYQAANKIGKITSAAAAGTGRATAANSYTKKGGYVPTPDLSQLFEIKS